MTNGPSLCEHPAQAFPGWLDLLATLMPETVKLEVSSWVLIVAVVALWIWRSCAPRGANGGTSDAHRGGRSSMVIKPRLASGWYAVSAARRMTFLSAASNQARSGSV